MKASETVTRSLQEEAGILASALADDPFYRRLASMKTGTQGLVDYLAWSIRAGERFGRVCRAGAGVPGLSIWTTPLSSELAAKRSVAADGFFRAHLGKEAADWYHCVGSLMNANSAPLISRDAWYLSILGLAPDHQGKGMGASLIEPIISETDRLGIATWLETFTPRNRSFYQRLGYRKVATFDCPPIGSPYCLMIR